MNNYSDDMVIRGDKDDETDDDDEDDADDER